MRWFLLLALLPIACAGWLLWRMQFSDRVPDHAGGTAVGLFGLGGVAIAVAFYQLHMSF